VGETSNFSDTKLIELAQNGDNTAFTTLVLRYEQQVAKTVIGMLGNTMEADDVGQETFVRFYQSLRNFRGESGVRTYITRIAINLSLNELKKRKRKNLFFFLSKDDKELEIPDNYSNTDQNDIKETVNKAIHSLEPHFRSVVVLRMIDGYSTKETAQILNLPEGTVLSRLARAQKKLKNILGKLIE